MLPTCVLGWLWYSLKALRLRYAVLCYAVVWLADLACLWLLTFVQCRQQFASGACAGRTDHLCATGSKPERLLCCTAAKGLTARQAALCSEPSVMVCLSLVVSGPIACTVGLLQGNSVCCVALDSFQGGWLSGAG